MGGGGENNILRQIKKKFDENMGTILWIKYLVRGRKNECAGACETEDHLFAYSELKTA